MSNTIPSTTLQVSVLDVKGYPLRNAKVIARTHERTASETRFVYDESTASYSAREILSGTYLLTVSHDRFQEQSRKITIGVAPAKELFVLGEPGSKTYFREKVRMPVDAEPDLVAVSVVNKSVNDTRFLDELAQVFNLQKERINDIAEGLGIRLFSGKPDKLQQALNRFEEHPLIEYAGAVVSKREKGLSFLTRDIVVSFRGPRAEQIARIAAQYNCIVSRELTYSPHTWVLQWNRPASFEILDVIEQLADRDDVEWAEPGLYITPELDSITPTDFLWNGLWDRKLIGTPGAWQHLQDAGLDAFGDPDILLAVWDSGVQSAGGVPTNADFNGTLSNGAPKLFASFDFKKMVPGNDSPWNNHGSGVAGVAVAMANNAAPVTGQSYGVVGSAPNVQIMTIAGEQSPDILAADQYIWMAGFDPHSTSPGFPARLSRGADIITCSLGPGAGSPLSGTARAALDFVTTFGRGGKGTLCFLSTGNSGLNNVIARPWGAYEKSFAIAGTTLDDDGTTEIHAPFSGWGEIALSAPTQDELSNVHNPPKGYMTWGAHHAGEGNLISFVQTQTKTTAASEVGTTELTVINVAGFEMLSVIHVGTIGGLHSEPGRVVGINAITKILTVQGFDGDTWNDGMINPHPAGTVVMTGPANHQNNFGGTSSATPLCAGVAALVLSANPSLTYIEAREILRDTAVKFDLANNDPVGRWLDTNGNPSTISGLPAVKSGWYGYGRVDAAAAVDLALSFAATRDLVIRDNISDTGSVASSGAFWNSPDIWCRRQSPVTDPSALPAGYGSAGAHQDPKRGQSNWVYIRVKNNGTAPTLDAWIRISVTHWPGMEFTYPSSFQPTNGPADPLPSPMTPGTYFIGEVKVTGLTAGADQIVNVEWPKGLIPPETVKVGNSMVHWHPCLLAEITPHDGPTPTGKHVFGDNNLAQKNISIASAGSGSNFQFANVMGNEMNEAEYLLLEVHRGKLPREVQLYVNLVDPLLRRRLHTFKEFTPGRPLVSDSAETPWIRTIAARPAWKIGHIEGEEVLLLRATTKVRVPIVAGKGKLSPVIVGGIIGAGALEGVYEIVIIQRQPDGVVSGSANFEITIDNALDQIPDKP